MARKYNYGKTFKKNGKLVRYRYTNKKKYEEVGYR